MNVTSQYRAQQLGLLGLAPLVVFTLMALLDLCGGLAIQLSVLYSAALLSFCGGIHWGLSMRSPTSSDEQRRLTWSLLPIVAGFAILVVGHLVTLPYPAILMLSLLALFHLFWFNYERRKLSEHPWYLEMRARQTFTTVALHVVMIITHST